MSSEHERIELLRRVFGDGSPAAIGIGDDAAVLPPSGHPTIVSVDASVEGVHFDRDWLSLDDIGYRATMAALSDLAAMGADPTGVFSALHLPASLTDDELIALAQGQARAAKESKTHVLGGNLSRSATLVLTTTVVGQAERPILRQGARVGDELHLAGSPGLAAEGLRAYKDGGQSDRGKAAWARPRARLSEGRSAAKVAHAMIDLSDGLAQDLTHLCRASGVGACLSERALRSVSPASLDDILYGGEDYGLLCALPAGVKVEGFSYVGVVLETGLWLDDLRGHRRAISPRGFDHFAK